MCVAVHSPSSRRYKVPTTPLTKSTLASDMSSVKRLIVAHTAELSSKVTKRVRCRRSVRLTPETVPEVVVGKVTADSCTPMLVQRSAGPRLMRVGREYIASAETVCEAVTL